MKGSDPSLRNWSYNYQGGYYPVSTQATSFTYTRPGTYTILLAGSANGTRFTACKQVKVRDNTPPNAQVAASAGGKVKVTIVNDPIAQQYDQIEILWNDGSESSYIPKGQSLEVEHTYSAMGQQRINVRGVYSSGGCNGKMREFTVSLDNEGTYTTNRCGLSDQAYSFDGVNDYINTPYSQNYLTSYTFSTWVYVSDPNQPQVAISQNRGMDGEGGKSLTLFFEKGSDNIFTLNFGLDGDFLRKSIKVPYPLLNQWVHVVAVWQGNYNTIIEPSQMKLYLNGSQATTVSYENIGSNHIAPVSGTGALKLAHHQAWNSFFKGHLDDIRIYSRALTDTEVFQLWQQDQQCTDAPVVHLAFDNIAKDISGNSNHGQVTGATRSMDRCGRYDRAYSFDGTDDYINTPYSQNNLTSYTFSTWVYVTEPNQSQVAISQNRGVDGGGGKSLTLFFDKEADGTLTLNFGLDGDHTLKTKKFPYNSFLNQWVHVVGSWQGTQDVPIDPSQIKLYINGILATSATSVNIGNGGNAPLSGIGTFQIGRHETWTKYFKGSLDDIRIYNRALTDTEVYQLWQQEGNCSVSTTDIALHYPLNRKANSDCEGSVSSMLLSASSYAICAGTGNSATLHASGCAGTVYWSTGQTGTSIIVYPSSTSTYTANCYVNGCTSSSSSLTISEIRRPDNVSLTAESTNICLGSGTTLYASNCPGIVYWSTGSTGSSIYVSPTTSTTYSAYCYANGCTSYYSSTININVTPRPAPITLAFVNVEHNRHVSIVALPPTTGTTTTYKLIIERVESGSGAFQQIAELTNSNRYTDTSAKTSERSYCYRITYENACGNRSTPTEPICTVWLQHTGTLIRWNGDKPFTDQVGKYYVVKISNSGPIHGIDVGTNTSYNTQLDSPNEEDYNYQIRAHSENGSLISYSNQVFYRLESTLCQSLNSGSWNSSTTWSCGRVPLSSDEVVIQPTHIVTLDGEGKASTIQIHNPSNLQFINGANLKVGNQ